MIRFAKPYLLFAVLSITCWAQSAQVSITKPVHGIPTRDKAAQSTPQASTTDNGIEYHGGPVPEPSQRHQRLLHLVWRLVEQSRH